MNTFCTEVDLDRYELGDGEKKVLKSLHGRILELPDFTIPASAKSADDLPEKDRATLALLDDIFWHMLPDMQINRIIEEVNPIGGSEKALAIEKILVKEDAQLVDVFYVGDSITDVEAFRMVKAAGGMALSFNGNDWAVSEASFAVTAQSALPVGWLAMMFMNQGVEGFRDLTISEVNPENQQRIASMSCRVRRGVRTEKIGSLG